MSRDRPRRCMPLGRSPTLTATLEAVGADDPQPPPTGPHAPTTSNRAMAVREARMPPTLRDGIRGPAVLSDPVGGAWGWRVATFSPPRDAPRPTGPSGSPPP